MEATTVTPTTPSATPATPMAAPATSAPSAEATPSQRPTFAEAFASDSGAAPAPTPATDSAAAATVQPLATSSESATGPIPFEVHKTALANARTKEADRVRQEYAWTQGLDRTAVESAQHIGQLYQQDRPGFIRQVMAEALADPTMAPLMRSEAARALGSRAAAAPTQPDLSPDVPVMDGQGQIVTHTYSADRMKQVVQQAIQEFASKELQPIQQDYQTRQARDQAQQANQAIQTEINDIYAEAVDVLPGFKAHEAAIAQAFAEMPPAMAPDRALRLAWKQVVGGTLENGAAVRASQLTELQTKAAASSVNPAAAVASSMTRPRSFHDASLKWT